MADLAGDQPKAKTKRRCAYDAGYIEIEIKSIWVQCTCTWKQITNQPFNQHVHGFGFSFSWRQDTWYMETKYANCKMHFLRALSHIELMWHSAGFSASAAWAWPVVHRY
jgi:hypothetical protein